jgi:hypothetical protein
MLRSVPDKLGGVVCMISAIVFLYFLPQPNKIFITTSYNFYWSVFTSTFFVTFVFLGWLGSQSVEPVYVLLGQVLTFYYFFCLLFFGFFFSLFFIPTLLKQTNKNIFLLFFFSGSYAIEEVAFSIFFIFLILSLISAYRLFFTFQIFGDKIKFTPRLFFVTKVNYLSAFVNGFIFYLREYIFWLFPFLHVALFLI